MSLKQALLAAINTAPLELREIFKDPELLHALEGVGVGGGSHPVHVFELHSPAASARKNSGLGKALCGRNAMRHRMVTCKDCLAKSD